MKFIHKLIFWGCFFSVTLFGQNVVIVVLDGARYSETLGADSLYIPNMWKQFRPMGTIWTNFRNEGLARTDPGHATIATGVWQKIDNKGAGRPNDPTIFEYFRKHFNAQEQTTAIVAGKRKLDILSYSLNPEYGINYKAQSFICTGGDTAVINKVKTVLSSSHPRLIMINLPGVDAAGHSGDWTEYTSALRTADSLIWNLWQTLQKDSIYRNSTSLLVTNDHGRHDDANGGFEDHGDDCAGCRHIMLISVGRGFSKNTIITKRRTQCDIAPTVGELLSFPTKYSIGTSLLEDTVASE